MGLKLQLGGRPCAGTYGEQSEQQVGHWGRQTPSGERPQSFPDRLYPPGGESQIAGDTVAVRRKRFRGRYAEEKH
jgi:hypothetical protein